MSASPEPPRSGSSSSHADGRGPPPVYQSRDLLGDREEVQIEHAGVRYRLRRTRQDKLILTK